MKSLIIGLDGADWRILDPLINRGQLPTLKRLIDRGCRGILRSTIPPFSPPAWASMITGVNPGKHGVFDFTNIDKEYQIVTVPLMNRLKAMPFWRILNKNGISTGIVNLPILYPPEDVIGYLVCGMVTPESAEIFSYPQEISKIIGKPGENWLIGQRLSPGFSLEEFLLEIKAKTIRQAELTLQLIEKFMTQTLMVVFDGGDKAQHFFWKYSDPSHPRYEQQANEALKSAISDYYINLDVHLGRILERFGESDIIIVSDHGFGELTRAFHIERWLLEKGYLELKPSATISINRISGQIFRRIWTSIRRLRVLKVMAERRAVLERMVQRTKVVFHEKGNQFREMIDWNRTKVFFMGRTSSGLRINVRGREKLGIISEGEEYTDLVEKLKTQLAQISDPSNQRSVIRNIFQRGEIYDGPQVGGAPDLIIMPESGYGFIEGFSDEYLESFCERGRELSGNHRMEGIFIASGPDFKKLEHPVEANIVDIMPTILYLNHLSVPNYVDGDVITSIIHDDYKIKNPIKHHEANVVVTPTADGYSDDERKQVEEHLKALGYL